MQKIILWVVMALSLVLCSVAQAAVDNSLPVYQVNRVAADDTLNFRAVSGVDGDVISKIPHNAKFIKSTGKTRKLGRSVWVEIYWGGKRGWVNKYYLLEQKRVGGTKSVGQKKPEKKKVTPRKKSDKAKDKQTKKSAVYMQCSGTEPFWTIKVTEKQMEVHVMDAEKYQVAVDFRKQSANNTSIAVVAGRRGNAFTSAFLQKVEVCSDGMSDKQYPYSVTALLNGRRVVSGCCSIVGAQ